MGVFDKNLQPVTDQISICRTHIADGGLVGHLFELDDGFSTTAPGMMRAKPRLMAHMAQQLDADFKCD